MLTLTQFLLRMSFGLSLAMAITSPRLVTSGYYRNNLYVLLGMNVLATLVAWTAPPEAGLVVWPPAAAAVLSYVSGVLWLYEKPTAGIVSLVLISAVTLAGAWLTLPPQVVSATGSSVLAGLEPLGGGLVLGGTMAAMLLGHWYLNAPGMKLAPLRKLLIFMAAAIAFRAATSAWGLVWQLETFGPLGFRDGLMIGLRWLAGIVGALVVVVMAWQTLKIPNTQSATGILYVGVLATFLGELTAQLLSVQGLSSL